ncbi:MAG: hypothetical protein U5R06_20680 [candidate division KSB1 bacterium]|nr:hypothetical protein [candidate division KSB1 bacterium]
MTGEKLVVDKTTKYYYLVTHANGERGYVLQNQVRVVRRGFTYGARLKSYYSRLDTLKYQITATAVNGQTASVSHKTHFVSQEAYQRLYQNFRPPQTGDESKAFYKRPLFWLGTAVIGGLVVVFMSGDDEKKAATVNLHVDWD